jgi:UDP-N-acetylglucosamine 2-epimerase (non-hydrolysing)
MIDSFELMRPRIEEAAMSSELGLEPGSYGVVTLHRPSNVDQRDSLETIVNELLGVAATGTRLVFPVHPRTMAKLVEFDLLDRLSSAPGGAIRLLDPLPYIRFMSLVLECRFAITDSGGIQEETSYLGIPCLTLRDNTERPVTITEGTNRLVKRSGIAEVLNDVLERRRSRPTIDLWDGRTARRVADSLKRHSTVERAGTARGLRTP